MKNTKDGKKSEKRSTGMTAYNRNRIKAFEKVNRFDRSNTDQCLPWMEEIFTVACNHKRNAREEMLYNSGGSVQKTLYSLSSEATEDKIHDILLLNHSNLKTSSQHISAFQSIQQRPEEPLQTYNARYQSYYELAHEGLTIGSDGSKVSCIHYANSLHGKLGDEMEGRFNQRLPKTYRRHSRGPWTLNPGSLPSSASIPGRSMRSTTLMSAVTIRSLRSMRLNMSETLTIKVRIMIHIIKKTNIAIITIPTSLTTTRTAPTTATTPPAESSGTIRVTTQRYHQT